MFKRKSYYCLFLFIGLALNTQAQQDSVKNVWQQRQLYFSDSTKVDLYHFSIKSPLFMLDLMPNQLSRINIGQQLEQGKFVAAQGSSKTNTSFLKSDGVTILNGIKLYGAFSYQKVFEDSTRFAHQTRNNTTTPYYFGSPKNNHYERSVYNFKAIGAKNILNNKVMVGLGLAYTIGDHFSTNDPRGSIKEYQLNLTPTIAYNFNSNLKFGIGYTHGYGQETVNIGYKNRVYYESLNYPEYVNYLINGYGEPSPKTSNRKYNDIQTRSGFNLALTIANTGLGSFHLYGAQLDEHQQYDFRNDVGITRLADYRLSKKIFEAVWTKNVQAGILNAQLTYQNLSGEDFNLTYAANNYLYTADQLNLKLALSRIHQKTRFNYSIAINQADEERIDGITGNKVYYKNLALNAGFGINKQLDTYHAVGIHFGAHYGFNLDNQFNVSQANESYFTNYVIYHDYLYHTASKMGGSISGDYSFPFFNLMQGAIKLNLFYTVNQQLKNLNRTLVNVPGNDRLFSNLSFNLYF